MVGFFEVGRLLLRAAREFSREICHELSERDHPELKPGHALLVANLEKEGVRVSTLAERAEISKQAMGQLIREMEALGYVTRAVDKADKRAVLILPTERGQQLLEDVAQVARIIEARQKQKIGEHELIQLRETLLKWLD